MTEPLSVVLMVEGAVAIAFGLLLAFRGLRSAATWMIVVILLGFGTVQLLVTMEPLAALLPPRWFTSLFVLVSAAFLAFPFVYPGWARDPRRSVYAAWALTPGVTFAVVLLSAPGLVPAGGLADDLMGFYAWASFAVPTTLLFRAWLRESPGPSRAQLKWILVAFTFWVVHDSAALFVGSGAPTRNDAVAADVLAAMVLAVVLVGAGLVLARASRSAPADARDDRFVAAGVLAAFPVSLLQAVGPWQTHLVVDGLFVFILAYGVARYRVVDLDLRLRRGVHGGTLGAAGLAILLVVQQLIEQYVGTAYGLATGAVVAGIALFALTPLQRLAERVSRSAVPVAGTTESYLVYRRLEIYRAALEGMLRDGHLAPREAGTLAALRAELGVTEADHDLLEREARARLARAAAAPPLAP